MGAATGASFLPALLGGAAALLAGCMNMGPPPGPVLVRENRVEAAVERWYLLPGVPSLERRASGDGGDPAEAERIPLPCAYEGRRTGLGFVDVPGEASRRVYGDGERRLLVWRTALGSPAWLEGLRRGDAVLRVDGDPPPDAKELARRLGEGLPGTVVTMEVEGRDGRRRIPVERVESVDADSGTQAGWLYGSLGGRVRWDSWGLAGLAWARTSVLWETESREPARESLTGILWWMFSVRSDPRGTVVRLFWVLPIPIP